jgi:hypothetical protein
LATVVFGFEWYNYLNVTFWSKCSTLEQGNFVLNAPLVHILTSSYIVQCICNKMPTLKEFVRVAFFCFLANFI